MYKALIFSVVLFFLLCYLFSCNLNIIEGQDNMTDKYKCSEDFISNLRSEYLDNLEVSDDLKGGVQFFSCLFPLKELLIDFTKKINAESDKNSISKTYLKDIFKSGVKPILESFEKKYGNDMPFNGGDITTKLNDIKVKCEGQGVIQKGVDTVSNSVGIETQCGNIDILINFINELDHLYKSLSVCAISVFATYVAYSNLMISKEDLDKVYNNMEFVYKLNVDNYLMNELVIHNNGGSDEIRINYKELTKDIYDFYINRTDLTPPETSYNEFEEYLFLFENFKDAKSIPNDKLDYFRKNPPGLPRDVEIPGEPILQEVKSQNSLYNQTKSPGNCAMILKTAQDLISTDGINIDNNDEVAKQIEECAKQTGLYVDITLNSKVNKMPIVDNISDIVSNIPTPTLGPKQLFGKYPINNKPYLLDNATFYKGKKLPDDLIDSSSPGCIKRVSPELWPKILEWMPGKNPQAMKENKIMYSLDRCNKICMNDDKCNYFYLNQSEQDMGRCCMMESVDFSGGYKTDPAVNFYRSARIQPVNQFMKFLNS